MAEPDHIPDKAVWDPQPPPVLWPVPAVEAPALAGDDYSLTGRRVVVGAARGVGEWAYDQRAATPIHERNGQQVIGVLPESDWYRQQRDATVPVVPRPVPASRVFVDVTVPVDAEAAPAASDQSDLRVEARSASLVSDPNLPPVRWPRQATGERFLTGARCWCPQQHGPEQGWRVVGEPRRREVPVLDFSSGLDGLDTPMTSTAVPLWPEADWYRWLDTGEPPAQSIPIVETHMVYLE